MRNIILIALLMVSQSWAGQHRGAGDPRALKLIGAVARAVEWMKANAPDLITEIGDHDLVKIAQEADINFVPEKLRVEVGGMVVFPAILNEPADPAAGLPNRLTVVESRYDRIVNPRLEEATVLHEVLSLVAHESTGKYPISGKYAQRHGLLIDTLVPDYEFASAPNRLVIASYKCTNHISALHKVTGETYKTEMNNTGQIIDWNEGRKGMALRVTGTHQSELREMLTFVRTQPVQTGDPEILRLQQTTLSFFFRNGTRGHETITQALIYKRDGQEWVLAQQESGGVLRDVDPSTQQVHEYPDGSRTEVKTFAPRDLDAVSQMKIVSSVFSCHYKPIPLQKAHLLKDWLKRPEFQKLQRLREATLSLRSRLESCNAKREECERLRGDYVRIDGERDKAWDQAAAMIEKVFASSTAPWNRARRVR